MQRPTVSGPDDCAHARQRRRVWVGLLLAIVMVTAGQICWRTVAHAAPRDAGICEALRIAVRHPLFPVTIALFICMFLNWMIVLANADLSYAQPITALGYVTVAIAAHLIFGETISTGQVIGIALILAGVVFISRTKHRTTGPTHAPRGFEPIIHEVRP